MSQKKLIVLLSVSTLCCAHQLKAEGFFNSVKEATVSVISIPKNFFFGKDKKEDTEGDNTDSNKSKKSKHHSHSHDHKAKHAHKEHKNH